MLTASLFKSIVGLTTAPLLLKLEGVNPTGSIKYKTALGLLDAAEQQGLVRPGAEIIESSSGNLGIALAALCATRGYRFTCVVDPNATRQSLDVIRAYGGRIVELTQRDAHGGYLGTRIAYIKALIREKPDVYWTNQYHNPAGPQVHCDMTGPEISAHVPQADLVVIGAGTTGTLMGCLQHFETRTKDAPCVLAVDSVGSLTFSDHAQPRHIPGLGASHSPSILRRDRVSNVVLVPELQAIRLCRWLAQSHGILVGGSTGSVLAGLLARPDLSNKATSIVAISPDGGEKYLDTVFSDDWVQRKFGRLPAPFEACEADITKVA